MNKRQTITEMLRETAKKAGSINATARRAGIDYAALFRFIHGESDMRLSNADKLAEALGLELRRCAKNRR